MWKMVKETEEIEQRVKACNLTCNLRREAMPSYVIPEKCDGCKALDKTACQHICPNDLMVLNKDTMKAHNQEPEMCWECYNCVKICPTQAVEVRGYADFVPMGANVSPMRGTEDIMWTVKFRSGQIKRFKFPIRNNAEGSAVPDGGFPSSTDDLSSPVLFTEPESLGMSELAKL
jgi:adenylylsulfate reductase subunit B